MNSGKCNLWYIIYYELNRRKYPTKPVHRTQTRSFHKITFWVSVQRIGFVGYFLLFSRSYQKSLCIHTNQQKDLPSILHLEYQKQPHVNYWIKFCWKRKLFKFDILFGFCYTINMFRETNFQKLLRKKFQANFFFPYVHFSKYYFHVFEKIYRRIIPFRPVINLLGFVQKIYARYQVWIIPNKF